MHYKTEHPVQAIRNCVTAVINVCKHRFQCSDQYLTEELGQRLESLTASPDFAPN